jgi:hypothetical protein
VEKSLVNELELIETFVPPLLDPGLVDDDLDDDPQAAIVTTAATTDTARTLLPNDVLISHLSTALCVRRRPQEHPDRRRVHLRFRLYPRRTTLNL